MPLLSPEAEGRDDKNLASYPGSPSPFLRNHAHPWPLWPWLTGRIIEFFQTTARVATGGRGSLPGIPSPSIFHMQLFARTYKGEKRRGRVWV